MCFVNSGSYTLCHSPFSPYFLATIAWLAIPVATRALPFSRGAHGVCACAHSNPIQFLSYPILPSHMTHQVIFVYIVRRLDYKYNTAFWCIIALSEPDCRSGPRPFCPLGYSSGTRKTHIRVPKLVPDRLKRKIIMASCPEHARQGP